MVNPGWADLDRGLFSISVAASLAGPHPQTLRIYGRERLLDPARSAGGTRPDIGRLAEICALTPDGLNLAGIRRVLWEETRQLQAERPPRNKDRSSAPASPAARRRTAEPLSPIDADRRGRPVRRDLAERSFVWGGYTSRAA
jgi:MerR family transcriptional regulator/heat shock protein HspR